jgi:hypothetical protein
MRIILDIGLAMVGLVIALLSISVIRMGGATWGLVQIPVIVLVAMIFFVKESRMAALTIGMGLGFDLMSSYPFFVWTAILSATAFSGWWLSRTVLTNRSLPSLLLLGAVMRFFTVGANFWR